MKSRYRINKDDWLELNDTWIDDFEYIFYGLLEYYRRKISDGSKSLRLRSLKNEEYLTQRFDGSVSTI